MFKRVMLVAIGLAILGSGIVTFTTIPSVEADNQQQQALINDLERIGATHVYLEYWTGYRLMFQSQEKIICGIPPGLVAPGSNRYPLYYTIVKADPRSAHVFPQGSPDANNFAKKVADSSVKYRVYTFDGYIVYQPEVGAGQ